MNERSEGLRAELDKVGLECMLVTRIENVRYLTGFQGSNGAVLMTPDAALLMTDGRYREQANRQAPGWDVLIYSGSMVESIEKILPYGARCGFEVTCRYDSYRKLAKTLGESRLEPLDGTVEKLRVVKDAGEVRSIKAALGCALKGFAALLEKISPGMSERELAAELDYRMALAGADSPAFDTIVGSGPNSSQPHAPISDRRLEPQDLVMIDFGALKAGYRSDTTRTVCIRTFDKEQEKVHDTVASAVEAAMEKIAPGIEASAVDAAAREVVAVAGYGERFTHALGHGVGLETHESPTISSVSNDVLEPGMIFTIEPGIYIEGWGGVRIEEMVLITSDGFEILSESLPREIRLQP